MSRYGKLACYLIWRHITIEMTSRQQWSNPNLLTTFEYSTFRVRFRNTFPLLCKCNRTWRETSSNWDKSVIFSILQHRQSLGFGNKSYPSGGYVSVFVKQSVSKHKLYHIFSHSPDKILYITLALASSTLIINRSGWLTMKHIHQVDAYLSKFSRYNISSILWRRFVMSP